MQEGLGRSVNSSHLSQEYQSISSEQQSDFTRQQITFPPQPPQFSKIYAIYTKTTDKINRLHECVGDLQQKILELERCNQNTKFDETALEVFDDTEDETDFMVEYREKCEKKQKQLQKLAEIYSGLKKLNSQISICQNQRIKEAIMKYLQSHRKVINYAQVGQEILILCKETHSKKKNNMANLNALNKSVSGDSSSKKSKKHLSNRGSKDGSEDNYDQKEASHTLRLLSIKNLMYSFKSNQQLLSFDGDPTPQQLQQTKEYSEKIVNIMRHLKVHSSKKTQYQLSTYSPQEKNYALLDTSGKISIIDSNGEIKSVKLIDKQDKIVFMQIKNNELWVGSIQGVLRVYSIKDNQLKLSNILSCFYKDRNEISSYFLIGEPLVQKVLFSIQKGLFQLNLNTYQIKQISELRDNVLYIVQKYFITSQQICKPTIVKDKYQISRNEALNKWYYDFHPQNPDKRILFIQTDQKSYHRIIVGDSNGNINVISI